MSVFIHLSFRFSVLANGHCSFLYVGSVDSPAPSAEPQERCSTTKPASKGYESFSTLGLRFRSTAATADLRLKAERVDGESFLFSEAAELGRPLPSPAWTHWLRRPLFRRVAQRSRSHQMVVSKVYVTLKEGLSNEFSRPRPPLMLPFSSTMSGRSACCCWAGPQSSVGRMQTATR